VDENVRRESLGLPPHTAYRALTSPMPIHVAITRRVRPGCEAEFQEALREFFQLSFSHGGVLGASMLVPPPGSDSREFGILRTFASEAEHEAFQQWPPFLEFDRRARELTEGEPVSRKLHGLEAWFSSPGAPPPRWKMAVVTFVVVWPVSEFVARTVAASFGESIPYIVRSALISAGIVAILTWMAMPVAVRAAGEWLHPKSEKLPPPVI